MTSTVVSNSCRLTIISSTLRVDLAVPAQISVSELLSIVVGSLGREAADLGAAEGGWVLQRAAEAPLDPAASLTGSKIRDGDTLYLRTRASQLPEVAFDDVLDAVATGVLTRTARWQPVHSMRAAATFAGALLTFGLGTTLVVGPKWVVSAVTAGVSAVLLVLAAIALLRVFHRRVPALVAGAFAVAFAVASGATAVGGSHALLDFGAPQVLVGVSGAALVATVLVITLVAGIAGFVAVITVAVLTAIGTAIASATTLSAPATAAIIATAGLGLSPFLATASFRLSRLPLPVIPLDAADLRRDSGAIDSRQILGQAVRADEFLTGLVGGVALAIAGSAVLISGAGVSERVLAVVLGVICLLRARLFSGRAQRILMFASGGVALLAVLVTGAADVHGTTRVLAFTAPVVVAALVLLALAVALPERRYAPTWARSADMLESLLVLSVIPLALGVMGVYGKIRTSV